MLWTDEEFFVEYENLYEFLRETQWDDGKPRKTGTMLITVDAGSLKAVVHDRDGKRCAWVTADTFKQLLNRIDTAIGTATLEWRRDTR